MNWESLLSTKRRGDKSDQPNANNNRSRFEQDFDRIIFSQPFRTLQDKTQVFPMPDETFVHNRLTHSLEVSSVGRSLGKNAGAHILKKYQLDRLTDRDFGNIVATASLAHDIGNPPFGHAGEQAISAFFKETELGQSFRKLVSDHEWTDLTNFEGNAQGFRILNHSLYRGMDLTYAAYGAFTKYPLSSVSSKERGRKSQKKYGYFASDASQFENVATELGLHPIGEGKWCRHPLAFLVEAADDICYGIIDFEDGCRLGLVSLETYTELLAEIIGEKFSSQKMEKAGSLNEKLGILRALAITQLVSECSSLFGSLEDQLLEGTFDKALTGEIESAPVLDEIARISLYSLYRSRQVLERESGGFSIISRLMTAFGGSAYAQFFGIPTAQQETIFRLFPEEYKKEMASSRESVFAILQLVTDYVSSLTDRYAVRLDKIISGQ